jgi:hypothetical protein
MRPEILLLFLISLSFSLVSPPLEEVHQNNLDNAHSLPLHENILNVSEREPTLGNPTYFAYAKILTLSPSVNGSITAAEHPHMFWIVAEGHEDVVREVIDGGDCPDGYREREFQEFEIRNMEARFVLDGLISMNESEIVSGGWVELPKSSFREAEETVELCDSNCTEFENPLEVPFKKEEGIFGIILDVIDVLLGPVVDFDECMGNDYLECASPMPEGVLNVTVRNLTVRSPELKVEISGELWANYTETGEEPVLDEDGECDSEEIESYGEIAIPLHDSGSFPVYNSYGTIIPVSPGYQSLSGNTTDNVVYYMSVQTTVPVHKYESVMDNKSASVLYIYNFSVDETDGIRQIKAVKWMHEGRVEEDSTGLENYTGRRALLFEDRGVALRNTVMFTNMSYNYSRVYVFKEKFNDLEPGDHFGEFIFYDWFGNNFTASSHIVAHRPTVLKVYAKPSANGYLAGCRLTTRGEPVAGEEVRLTDGHSNLRLVTNGDGRCQAEIASDESNLWLIGNYNGSRERYFLPSTASGGHSSILPVSGSSGDWVGASFVLMMLVGLLFAASFFGGGSVIIGFLSSGHPGVGMDFMKEYMSPGKKKKGKKKDDKKDKKGKKKKSGAGESDEEDETVKKKKEEDDAFLTEEEEEIVLSDDEDEGQDEDKLKKEAYEKKKKKAMIEEEERKKNKIRVATLLSAQELEETLKSEGRFEKQTGALRLSRFEPKIEFLKKYSEESCKNIGKPQIAKKFLEAKHEVNGVPMTFKIQNPKLRVVDDIYFNEYLSRSGADDPHEVSALTNTEIWANLKKGDHIAQSWIYIRESHLGDQIKLIGDIDHERTHPYNKLTEEHQTKRIEGFTEHLMYKEVQRDEALPSNVKDKIRITEPYRQFVAQDYLVEQIIGKDHNAVGHLIEGEDHLRKEFDKVAGEGRYDEIFASEKDPVTGEWVDKVGDGKKIDQLQNIFDEKNKDDPAEQSRVSRNVRNIREEGKYEL